MRKQTNRKAEPPLGEGFWTSICLNQAELFWSFFSTISYVPSLHRLHFFLKKKIKKNHFLSLNISLFCKCQYQDGQKVHWGEKQDIAIFLLPGGWAPLPYSRPAAAILFEAEKLPLVMLLHVGPSDGTCLLQMYQHSQLNSPFSREVIRLVGTVNN